MKFKFECDELTAYELEQIRNPASKISQEIKSFYEESKSYRPPQTVDSTSNAEQGEVFVTDRPLVDALNSRTDFLKLIKRVPTNSDRAHFVVRTARNTTFTSYGYLDPFVFGFATRQKVQFDIVRQGIGVGIDGLDIEGEKGSGVIRDIIAAEKATAVIDFWVGYEDMIFGDGTGTNATNGIQNLIDDGSNFATIYGITRSGTVFASGYNATSESLTITRMRAMINYVIANGAKEENLMFLTNLDIKDKYRNLLLNYNTITGTGATPPSAFGARLDQNYGLDGIPLVGVSRSTNFPSGHLYLLSMDTLKIYVLLMLTEQEIPTNIDARGWFMKMYSQFICDVPHWNYKKINIS